ncbi:hypothetical protein AMAG_10903 [Allomyces macrogynus ATCC 38327]|uniref:Uncharacterized protein n=1 Tax=Allomyces macrogynus (strain ATCC 38327) TaxID=578462 RepID=A0A0L0SSB8_ALLM3|nr:hypothetical protein AMAG_10903 [Allomyces macrogynus ATCC 38327]|eukprot:KNE65259.1 hypothetical protein AMAG_10903 [Allomyces macrogynus ATCC 38327]
MSSLSASLLAPPPLGVSPATAVSPASSPMAASPAHSPSYLTAADAMQLDVHVDDVDAIMNDGAGVDDEDALSAVMDDVFDDSDVEMGVTTPVARAELPPVADAHVSPLFRPHAAAHPLAPLVPLVHQQSVSTAVSSSESPVAQIPTPVSPLSAASVLAEPVPPLARAEVESLVPDTVAATVDSADSAMNEHASTNLPEVPLPSFETDDAVEAAAPTDATAASLLSSQAPDSSIDSAAHVSDLSHSDHDGVHDDDFEFSKLPSSDGDAGEHQEHDGEEEDEEELEAAALLKYDDHIYTLFSDQDAADAALFATTDLFYDEPINDLIRQLKAHFGLAQAEVALRFDNLEGLTIHEETDIAHSNHLVNFANLLRTLKPDSDTPLTMTLQVLGESAQWKLDQLVRRAQALLEQDEDDHDGLRNDDEHVSFEHDDFALDGPVDTQPQQHQTEVVPDANDAQEVQPPASSESHPTTPTSAQISPAHSPATTTTTPPPHTCSTTSLPASPTSVSPVPAADATVAHPTLTVDAVVANGYQPPVVSVLSTQQAHGEDDDGLVAYEEDAVTDNTSSGSAAPAVLSPTADHVFPARYGASRTVSPTLSPQQSVFSVAAMSASAPMSPRMGAAVAAPTRPGLPASPSLVGAALGAVAAATSRGALFAPMRAEGAETEEVASETVGDAAPTAVPSVEDALHGSRKRGLELDDGAASSPKKPRLDVAADLQGQ